MSSMFDNVRQRASSFVEDVSSEWERQRRITQLENEVEELHQKKNEQTYQLGQLVLTLFREDRLSEAEVAEPCRDLLAVEEEIATRRQMVQELQQMETQVETVCPQCNATLPAGAQFCWRCGTPQAEYTEETVDEATCAQCGAALVGGASFCSDCGAVVAEAEPGPPPSPPAQSPSPAEGADVADVAVRQTCVQCGTALEAGTEFCSVCGWVVGSSSELDAPAEDTTAAPSNNPEQPPESEAPGPDAPDLPPAPPMTEAETLLETPSPVAAPEPEAEAASSSCPQCGSTARPGAGFCPGCGTAINSSAGQQSSARTHCGITLASDMRFCPQCGAHVPLPEEAANVPEPAPDSYQICGQCGTSFSIGTQFCPACGQPAET